VRTDAKPALIYTERLLRDLPPRALVLGRQKAVIERLLAAQALGERHDVLIVPEPALGHSRFVRDFLALEPAMEKLVLDLNLAGTPSEYALYQLTDKRPVFVEINPAWDVRLLSHLAPRLGLAEYSPHALSNSERRAFLEHEEPRIAELLQAIRSGLDTDITTAELSEKHLAALAAALGRVGDRASAERLSADWEREPHEVATEPPGLRRLAGG
jgi:hypothetical protein